MKRSLFPIWIFIAAGLTCSTLLTVQRWQIERAHRDIAIVLDMDEFADLADRATIPLPEFFKDLKKVGATGIALSARTLEDTERNISFNSSFSQKYKDPLSTICTPPTLFDQTHIETAKAAGLDLIVRMQNRPELNAVAVNELLQEAQVMGAKAVIFEGKEILGYQDLIPLVRSKLSKAKIDFGMIEFSDQLGARELAKQMEGHVLRAHSISRKELANLNTNASIRRFVRAVRERHIDICYVHPIYRFKANPIASNRQYIAELHQALKTAGFETRLPTPLAHNVPSKLQLFFISFGMLTIIMWLMRLLHPIPDRTLWMIVSAGAVLLAVIWWRSQNQGLMFIPLISALFFPLLGMLDSGTQTFRPSRIPSIIQNIRFALTSLVKATAITTIGSLIIVGLLFHTDYMLKLEQFRGVKISQLLPFVIFAFLLIGDLHAGTERLAPHRWANAKRRWSFFFSRPVSIGHITIAGVALGFIVYWLMRTSNQPDIGASLPEMKIRETLENLLIARPRFKEFLIGHPAFVLATVLSANGRRTAALPLYLLALIGQLSILNSFTHIHTPLWLSCLRTFHGLWLGFLVGTVLAIIVLLVWRLQGSDTRG